MKTEILLFIVLAALLLVPIAMAGEQPAPASTDTEILRGSGHELASLMLAKKTSRKGGRDAGFRDTDPVPGNPHPDGKGKIVSGIVISSVGGGIGVGLMTYSIFNYCGYSYDYSYDENGEYTSTRNEDEVERCKKTNQMLLIGGAATTAISLGVGLPRMFQGIKERKIWKQWNRDNAKRVKRRTETRTVYQYKMFMAPDAASQALALGFNFNY